MQIQEIKSHMIEGVKSHMNKLKISIKLKFIVIFALFEILLIAGMGVSMYILDCHSVTKQYEGVSVASAKMAANLINGNSINDYLKSGKNTEYTKTYKMLQKLKINNKLKYLYVFTFDKKKNKGTCIFDIYSSGDDKSLIVDLGASMDETDISSAAKTIYSSDKSGYNRIVTNTKYGYLISSYEPVYDSSGKLTAVVGADVDMNRIIDYAKIQVMTILAVSICVIVLFSILLVIFINRKIVRHITELSRHMTQFTRDKDKLSEEEITIRTGDEIEEMAESFNAMAYDIHTFVKNLAYVTADKERIATELNVATKIQSSMLPCIFPAFPERKEFDIFASMTPAKEVGGDFYDFFLIDEDHLALVIADVSGKGVPAALFMVITKTLIKNNAQSGKSPAEVFTVVNNILCENNDEQMFVTAFMGYLEISSGKFVYVNAGHNPPLIKHKEGDYAFIATKAGFVLGGMEGIEYREMETSLPKGSSLFCYTDGVTEAVNTELELYSEARLLEKMNQHKHLMPAELIRFMRREVEIFESGAKQADDITMLSIYIYDGGRKN